MPFFLFALYDWHNCTHQYKQTKRIKASEARCFSAESFSTWVNTELSSSYSGSPGHMECRVQFFPPSRWITMLHTQSTYALRASSTVTLKLWDLISYGYRTDRHNRLNLKCWCWLRTEMSNAWWTVRELQLKNTNNMQNKCQSYRWCFKAIFKWHLWAWPSKRDGWFISKSKKSSRAQW